MHLFDEVENMDDELSLNREILLNHEKTEEIGAELAKRYKEMVPINHFNVKEKTHQKNYFSH